MKIKAAVPVLLALALAISLFALPLIAQDIGHLGVNDDPAPLFQVKRVRKFIARNLSRKMIR
jgi:hypothetical protein